MSDSRLEKFIYAICSMDVSDLPVPLSRIEKLWNCLITGETPDFEPLSRNEKYLMAMLDRYDISNLPAPMSRGEKLLYKIAVGETDLSDVPGYLSRYEELLKYLIENGGISGGDFEYVLYTLNQSLYTLYTTAEKPVKSAILKGQTIKRYKDNLFDGIIESGGLGINSGENDDRYPNRGRSVNFIKVEPNSTITFVRNLGTNGFHVVGYNENKEFVKGFANVMKANVLVGKINTTSDIYYVKFYDVEPTSESEFGVFQGDVEPTYELVSVKMPVLTTVGKNLFDMKNCNFITEKDGNYYPSSNSDLFDTYTLLPNTTYTISGIFGGWGKCFVNGVNLGNFNSSGNRVAKKFTTDSTGVTTIYFGANNSNDVSKPCYDFQLEIGDTFTTYEPFKSNILSTSEEVVLRGIEDVKDTLDCLTGELVERIGEIVLDGSENWRKNDTYSGTSGSRFVLEINDIKRVTYGKILCDKMQVKSNVSSWQTEGEYISADETNLSKINIRKTQDMTIEEFKQWLSQNPITVQYQLVTESVKTVDLTVVDQDNQPTQLGTFENVTHVSLEAENLIPEVEMEVATNLLEDTVFNLTDAFNTLYPTAAKPVKSAILTGNTLVNLCVDASEKTIGYSSSTSAKYDYRETLKPNTTYTILFKISDFDENVGSVIEVSLDSGYKTYQTISNNGRHSITFTTQSDTTNYTSLWFYFLGASTITGKSSDIIVLEGDYANLDVPFFTGMQSVKMPVLSTMGKNLISMNNFRSYYNAEILFCNTNSITFNAPNDWAGVFVNLSLKPNTEYHISYECQNDNTIKTIIRYLNDDETLTGETYGGENNFSFMTKDNGKVRVSIESNTIQDNIVLKNIQLEEGTVATSYEPHKTNILTTPEDLELRGIGDVKDELDLLTGEFTQRIGEIDFNTLQFVGLRERETTVRFSFVCSFNKLDQVICNNYPVKPNAEWNMDTIGIENGYGDLSIAINKSELSEISHASALDFINNKGIRVWGILRTPIIKTVDLTVQDQNGNETKLGTFDDTTHALLNSEGLIPTAVLTVRTKIPSGSSTSLLMDDISTEQQQLETTVDKQSENVDATMIATTEIYEETL